MASCWYNFSKYTLIALNVVFLVSTLHRSESIFYSSNLNHNIGLQPSDNVLITYAAHVNTWKVTNSRFCLLSHIYFHGSSSYSLLTLFTEFELSVFDNTPRAAVAANEATMLDYTRARRMQPFAFDSIAYRTVSICRIRLSRDANVARFISFELPSLRPSFRFSSDAGRRLLREITRARALACETEISMMVKSDS